MDDAKIYKVEEGVQQRIWVIFLALDVSKRVLRLLRESVEDKNDTIARINASHIYPGNFMFVITINLCPCGNYGSKEYTRSHYEVKNTGLELRVYSGIV